MRHRLRRALPLAALLLATIAATRERPITVFLAGDSTMAEKRPGRRPETGWGEALPAYFAPGAVRIENRAKNGRSTRTFIAEGLWQGILDDLRPGDYVLVEFGHNDESKAKVDRYTPPADFARNLRRFVADVRAREGVPVLLTPVYRRKFDAAGHVVDTHGEYPDLVRAVAASEHVLLVDMHRLSGELLERWGPDSSRALFLQLEPGQHANYPEGIHDETHFSPLGARLVAELALREMRRMRDDGVGVGRLVLGL